MAGDWIPIATELPRRREVLLISTETGRSRHEVVGLLVDFWGWASAETSDGVLAGLDRNALVTLVGADEAFWRALEHAGWLLVGDGFLQIPRAETWLLKGAKARLQTALRQKRFREKASRSRNADSNARNALQNRTEESDIRSQYSPPDPSAGGGGSTDAASTTPDGAERTPDGAFLERASVEAETLKRMLGLDLVSAFLWRVGWLVAAGRMAKATAVDAADFVRRSSGVDAPEAMFRTTLWRAYGGKDAFNAVLARAPKRPTRKPQEALS